MLSVEYHQKGLKEAPAGADSVDQGAQGQAGTRSPPSSIPRCLQDVLPVPPQPFVLPEASALGHMSATIPPHQCHLNALMGASYISRSASSLDADTRVPDSKPS